MSEFSLLPINLLCGYCGFHRDCRFYDGLTICDDCAFNAGLTACGNCGARLKPAAVGCPLCGEGMAA